MSDTNPHAPDPDATTAETSPDESAALYRAAALPESIGGYTIKDVIGSGGMGTVYLAVQQHPRRTVALKVMKAGIASKSALRRFEYESQILARLRHPNIAQVYEAGTHDDGSGGVPYFAMEYIPNARPITAFARSKKLDARDRLALFAKVCGAVHHGHQKGIIHRDLKPDNILVDAHGEPKIIDFGVARATDSDLAITTLQTDIGQLIGTLQYMSPEQFDADPHDLDTRSDVYALGVILYELLCERPPYDIKQGAIHEAARVIREDAPTRPSSINRTMRGDLETITLTALEKERHRRYQSAAELAGDINRFLDNEPIQARPPSVAYLLRKLARRNRPLFYASATAAIALLVATGVSVTFAVLAAQAQSEAVYQSYLANIVAADVALQSQRVGSAETRLAKAPQTHRGWEWDYLRSQVDSSVYYNNRGLGLCADGGVFATISDDENEISIWETPGRRIASIAGPFYKYDHFDGKPGVGNDRLFLLGAWFSTSGRRVAIQQTRRTIGIWESRSGKLVTSVAPGGPCQYILFNTDGDRLVTKGKEIGLIVWNADTGDRIWSRPGAGIGPIALSPDDSKLVTWIDDALEVLDAESGLLLMRLDQVPKWPQSWHFTADGTHLQALHWAINDEEKGLWDYDITTGVLVRRLEYGDVSSVVINSAGAVLATGDDDGRIRIWDNASPHTIREWKAHSTRITRLVCSPSEDTLASGAIDGTVRLWNMSGRLIATPIDHEHRVRSVAFSADGGWLLARFSKSFKRSGYDEIYVWELDRIASPLRWPAHASPVAQLHFDASGRRLCSISTVGDVRVWTSPGGELLADLGQFAPDTIAVAFTDRSVIVAAAHDGDPILVVDALTGSVIELPSGECGSSAGGPFIAAGSDDVEIWDVRTGERQLILDVRDDVAIMGLEVSPDGSAVSLSSSFWARGRLERLSFLSIHDGLTGDSIARIRHPMLYETDEIMTVMMSTFFPRVKFSKHGSIVGTIAVASPIGSEDIGFCDIWRLPSTDRVSLLRYDPSELDVHDLAVQADGTRVALGLSDDTIRIHDGRTGLELLRLEADQGGVTSLAFSPDGTILASGGSDGSIRLWDTVAARSRHEASVLADRATGMAIAVIERTLDDRDDLPSAVNEVLTDDTVSQPVRRAAVDLLLRRAVDRLHRKTPETAQAFVAAIESGDLIEIRRQLERPGAVNDRIRFRCTVPQSDGDESAREYRGTPLHLAVWKGNLDIVSLLLEQGARVDVAIKPNRSTPLTWAASGGHLQIATTLLEYGADPNHKDNYFFRPLHFAAQDGHAAVVELLVSAGADLEASSVNAGRSGWTSLHLAASRGHDEVVELLLLSGADVHAVNQDGDTPLAVASKNEDASIASTLRRHGAE